MFILPSMEKEKQVNILWENSTSTLPSVEELTPITQSLISPELAIAFRIRSEVEAHQNFELHVSSLPTPNYFHADHEPTDQTNRPLVGKNEGSEENYQRSHVLIPPFHPVQNLQQQGFGLFSSQIAINLQKTSKDSTSRSIAGGLLFGSIADGTSPYDHDLLQRKKAAHAKISHEGAEEEEDMSSRRGGEKAVQEVEMGIGMDMEESMELGAAAAETTSGEELMQGAARTLKRPRLVWTPQLHKRFVDAVAHLGIKNAVPKTIMQLMNVEGLTRENVASHLQKYRLYLKRVQGIICNDGSSSSDHPLFASTISPSPQFFSHSTTNESTIPPALDLPVAGLKQAAHKGSSPQIGGLNQAAYMARARALAHHSSSSAVMQDQHQENGCTSSQGILTLFPMTSR